jgi:hypothetical protein
MQKDEISREEEEKGDPVSGEDPSVLQKRHSATHASLPFLTTSRTLGDGYILNICMRTTSSHDEDWGDVRDDLPSSSPTTREVKEEMVNRRREYPQEEVIAFQRWKSDKITSSPRTGIKNKVSIAVEEKKIFRPDTSKPSINIKEASVH